MKPLFALKVSSQYGIFSAVLSSRGYTRIRMDAALQSEGLWAATRAGSSCKQTQRIESVEIEMRRKQILPDLHSQAKQVKNRKKLQHDGGRAWIKDSQLQEALKGGNYRIETVSKNGSA